MNDDEKKQVENFRYHASMVDHNERLMDLCPGYSIHVNIEFHRERLQEHGHKLGIGSDPGNWVQVLRIPVMEPSDSDEQVWDRIQALKKKMHDDLDEIIDVL